MDNRPEHLQHYQYDSPKHGKRGPDKKPRAPRGKKTVMARYYEATGRRIEDDMRSHREKVNLMYEVAGTIEDPSDRLNALDKATKAEDSFNKTWLPYFQSKQGVMKVTDSEEDMISLEDVLSGDANEDHRS